MRSRRFTFTIPDPTPDQLTSLNIDHARLRYGIWRIVSKESSSTKQVISGYLEFFHPLFPSAKYIRGALYSTPTEERHIIRVRLSMPSDLPGPCEVGKWELNQGRRSDVTKRNMDQTVKQFMTTHANDAEHYKVPHHEISHLLLHSLNKLAAMNERMDILQARANITVPDV